MQIRNIDENHDWQFGQSNINYVTEQEAVLLDIRLRLNEWYGDCFFARQKGIPWKVRLGNKNQKKLMDTDFVNTVLGTNGVLNGTDFTSSLINRRYTASITIYTQYSSDGVQFTYQTDF